VFRDVFWRKGRVGKTEGQNFRSGGRYSHCGLARWGECFLRHRCEKGKEEVGKVWESDNSPLSAGCLEWCAIPGGIACQRQAQDLANRGKKKRRREKEERTPHPAGLATKKELPKIWHPYMKQDGNPNMYNSPARKKKEGGRGGEMVLGKISTFKSTTVRKSPDHPFVSAQRG